MEIKTSVSYLKNEKCADVYTESQTDYVLPDYLGDVRKILFSEASLRPSGRFAGGDEVEFSGIVVYDVIYLDADGRLASASFSSDYDYSVKCTADSYNDSIADTRVSNYAVRLLSPRKINAKASLVGSVRLSEREVHSVSGSGFASDLVPEVNTGSANLRTQSTSSVCEREYAESVARLDGAIADELAVIYSSAEAVVEEVRGDENRAYVKGKMRMLAVIQNGDEPAYSVEKTVSFDEGVDFDGISPEMILTPQLTVTSLTSSVNADEGGCEVVLSGIVEMCVIGEQNQSVELILDAYLKEVPTDNAYDGFSYTTLRDSVCLKSGHNAEIDRSEIESDGLREVIFLTSTPKVDETTLSDGRVNIVGEIRYSGIASETAGDKISYLPIRFSSPFEINVNVSCQIDEKCQADVELHSFDTTASLDSNKLYASCTIECKVSVSSCEEKSVLSDMTIVEGESFENEEARVTVYYPTSSDTLFSVAKRFHTSGLKLAGDNGITEAVFSSDNPTGSLKGVKRVIIY